ncbi:MAG TPA: type IX secretion system protein PorQ [Calditrichia bacterium]|nr:type IX secretion system protein PorQ [Calditrichota bacterium]HQV32896.1 type IX secretion system protein PorQ [Calditrichia bacterium]
MKRSTIFVLLLLLSGTFLMAQSVGTTDFSFLKNQYSPRGAGLAGNLIAVQGDVNAMFYNPAGLKSIEEQQVSINYVDHLLDLQGGQLAYARSHAKYGTVGVGLVYFNYGDFQETDDFGEELGRTFGATEFALGVSVANTLGEGFDFGVNVKYIYSSLDSYSASALGLDAGLIYHVPMVTDLQLAFTISNLGIGLQKYADQSLKMPLFLRVGGSKKLAHLPLRVSLSLNDLSLQTGDNADLIKRFSISGEFDVSEPVKFRIGYDNGSNQNLKPLSGRNFGGLSAGVGISVRKMRLDYAFSTSGDLGTQNRLGVMASF